MSSSLSWSISLALALAFLSAPQLLLHLHGLLGLGDEVLLVIQLGGQLGVVLVLVANNRLQLPLASLKAGNRVLGPLEVTPPPPKIRCQG